MLTWLTQDPAPPSQGPEFGHSSPIALVVTLVLLLALVFLIKSMNGHLRKLPTSFDESEHSEPTPGAATPDQRTETPEPNTAGHPNGATPGQ